MTISDDLAKKLASDIEQATKAALYDASNSCCNECEEDDAIASPETIDENTENMLVGNTHTHKIAQADATKGNKGILGITTNINETDANLVPNVATVKAIATYQNQTGKLSKFDAKYAQQISGYPEGTRLELDNSNVTVISLVDANTVNPNTDMTSWAKLTDIDSKESVTVINTLNQLNTLKTFDNRTVYFIGRGLYKYDAVSKAWNYQQSLVFNTVAEMLAMTDKVDGMKFIVKSYNTPDYTKASPFEGGGDFIYVASLKDTNDGGVVINGCVRLNPSYLKLTPEMFGAVGNGTNDDYQAIQNMLNVGAKGCVFEFDGSKVYYNAMSNDGTAVDVDKRNLWKRTQSATFNFHNAELRIRTPKAIANGSYSDTGGYVLLLDNIDGIFVYDANINGNSPLGTLKWIDMTDWYNAPKDTYCVGDTGFEGIHFKQCTNIKFMNSMVQRCGFNVFLDRCSRFAIDNLYTTLAMQSLQGIKDSNNTDAALGAGLKVYQCSHGSIKGLHGYRNVNATPEIEHNNINVSVEGFGEEDFANSLIVYASQHIKLDYNCKNTFGGGFALYAKSGQFPLSTQFVSGQVTIDGCNNVGFVFNCENITENIDGINLDITTKNCKSGGMQIINGSTSAMPRNIQINHTSINDGESSNWQRYYSGYMTGRIKGSSVWDTAPTVRNFCIKIEGTNTKDTCLVFEMDLTDNNLYPYSVVKTAYLELVATRLQYAMQYLSARAVDFKTVTSGADADVSGGSSINFRGADINVDIATDGGYVKSSMLSIHNAQNNALYVDPATRTADGNGFTYSVKMYKTS